MMTLRRDHHHHHLLLLPANNPMKQEAVLNMAPDGLVIACDFYVEGAEQGEEVPGGYRLGRMLNIDHHAPTPRMSRVISSTNLAIAQLAADPINQPATVVLNHTDCDSILSGGVMAGLLQPDLRYGAAAIAADHTGEENSLADLLQSLEPFRDPDLSFRNLAALEKSCRLDDVATKRLRLRKRDRLRAELYVTEGRFRTWGYLQWAVLDTVVDATFFPALLPDAWLILLAMPMNSGAGRWEAKLRLGLAAPVGLTLHKLEIHHFDPAFGGRWNAGSNRRAGGTSLAAEAYAARLVDALEAYFSASSVSPRSM